MHFLLMIRGIHFTITLKTEGLHAHLLVQFSSVQFLVCILGFSIPISILLFDAFVVCRSMSCHKNTKNCFFFKMYGMYRKGCGLKFPMDSLSTIIGSFCTLNKGHFTFFFDHCEDMV